MSVKVFTPAVRTAKGVQVRLRDIRKSDGQRWRELRIANEACLRPVEPTVEGDWVAAHSKSVWRDTFSYLHKSRRRGEAFPLVIETNGVFSGQVTLGNIQYGSVSNCWIGYWLDQAYTGQGITTAAVALGVDFAMRGLGLHRVEATVMEDNPGSIGVLRNVGFRREGMLLRNIHINGVWQDHWLFAQTREDAEPEGIVQRLVESGRLLLDCTE